MIQPITLSATHMECRNLEDSFAVMTELLAFEKMSKEPGEATLKHPNSPWVLVLHEAGKDAPAKPMHNHWGVRVLTTAHEYLIRTPLKELVPQLDAGQFWQVHRGTVVRADAIDSVTRDEAGKLYLQLRGRKEKLAVSRLYAHLFKAM